MTYGREFIQITKTIQKIKFKFSDFPFHKNTNYYTTNKQKLAK